MATINGYMGKMLLVDLTSGKIEEKELTKEMANLFIGGYGIGARVLYDMIPPGADPLGPNNVLGILTGPLTGTGALFSGRFTVVCKSPVTGGWNDANCGGYFGPELKKAGFDAIFFSGASSTPVYLWVKEGKAELRDASILWGKGSVETEDALKEAHGEKRLGIACIGPAGEKLSLISAVMNDGHRAAGRGGVGAVMGSKKLKAVVVKGTMKTPIADVEALKRANKELSNSMKNGPTAPMVGAFAAFGTGVVTGGSAVSGDSPVKNWRGIGFRDFGEDNAKMFDYPSIDAKYNVKRYACAVCPLGCGAHYELNEGEYAVGKTSRPEYETAAGFGCFLLNNDIEAVIKCNHICNIYGTDTISTAGTIGWAMECYENGIFTIGDTGGIDLKWGNAKAMVQAVQVLADQSTEFGKLLALGSAGAAKKIGKGFEYLVTVKGIELPMHDPKYAPGLSRTYSYDPTPARHVKGGIGFPRMLIHDDSKYIVNEDDEKVDVDLAATMEIVNSVGLCQFSTMIGGVPDIVEKMMTAVTGENFGVEDKIKAGTRILTMRHMFNIREGLKPSDFAIPSISIGNPPHEMGPLKGITINHEKDRLGFFATLDWNESTGIPSKAALEKLGGMEDIVSGIYK